MALSLRPTREQKGSLAEWLGAGLQNRLQQFDSARNLEEKNKERGDSVTFLFFFTYPPVFSPVIPLSPAPALLSNPCFGMMFGTSEAMCNFAENKA